jgi:hypothetical protein
MPERLINWAAVDGLASAQGAGETAIFVFRIATVSARSESAPPT